MCGAIESNDEVFARIRALNDTKLNRAAASLMFLLFAIQEILCIFGILSRVPW
jgi:hypothetical protein